MAGKSRDIIETGLDDRQILLHILTHVEDLAALPAQVQTLVDVLEEFRPLLNLIKGGNGKPDYIGLAQAGRTFRKAGRRAPA
jgi:hypothetical protein